MANRWDEVGARAESAACRNRCVRSQSQLEHEAFDRLLQQPELPCILSVSYARPFRRRFHDDSSAIVLQYPIRFSAGFQEETFFNFTGGKSQQIRPYIRISLF
jgi:hypothetical protein